MMPNLIGRYEILERLGQGRMGVVYRARDPRLERDVALKVISLPEQIIADEMQASERLRRFEREVKAAAQLNHPHIVTVYDVDLEHQPPYVVMELLTGGTLRKHVRQKPLPWQEAAVLLRPLGQALAYAHRMGVIHRDVKPANVMFAGDKGNTLKLVDFGLARWQSGEQVTQTGGLLGTPAYMSPEQARGQETDARTDIFALGVLFFEAIAGHNPLDKGSLPPTIAEIMSDQSIDMSPLMGKAPPEVIHLIERAVARDRNRRYQSCDVLLADLARCLDDPASTSMTLPPLPPTGVSPHGPVVQKTSNISLTSEKEAVLRGKFSTFSRIAKVAAVVLAVAVVILAAIAGLNHLLSVPAKRESLATVIGVRPQVEVKRESTDRLIPVTFGMGLYRNDIVSTYEGAATIIVCENGILFHLPEQSNLRIDCKDRDDARIVGRLDPALNDQLASVSEAITPTLASIETRSSRLEQKQSPLLLSPRNTVVAETQPTFYWQPVAGARGYRLTLNPPSGKMWVRETTAISLPYPTDVPPLSPDSANIVTLVTLDDETVADKTLLRMLDEANLTSLAEAEDTIRDLALDEVAQGYLLAQLYRGREMWAAAISQLEWLTSAQGITSAHLWQQLGSLYFEIGLYTRAEENYRAALAAAETSSDKSIQAAAHTGLARVAHAFEETDQALDHLAAAEALYLQAGEAERAGSVAAERARLGK